VQLEAYLNLNAEVDVLAAACPHTPTSCVRIAMHASMTTCAPERPITAILKKACLSTCNACKRASDEPRRRWLREGAAVGRHDTFLADVRLRPAVQLAAEVRHFAGAAIDVDFVHKTQRIKPAQRSQSTHTVLYKGSTPTNVSRRSEGTSITSLMHTIAEVESS